MSKGASDMTIPGRSVATDATEHDHVTVCDCGNGMMPGCTHRRPPAPLPDAGAKPWGYRPEDHERLRDAETNVGAVPHPGAYETCPTCQHPPKSVTYATVPPLPDAGAKPRDEVGEGLRRMRERGPMTPAEIDASIASFAERLDDYPAPPAPEATGEKPPCACAGCREPGDPLICRNRFSEMLEAIYEDDYGDTAELRDALLRHDAALRASREAERQRAEDALRQRDNVTAAYRSEKRDKEIAQARNRLWDVSRDDCWAWEGGADASPEANHLETLVAPVVIRPEVLLAIFRERDEAREQREDLANEILAGRSDLAAANARAEQAEARRQVAETDRNGVTTKYLEMERQRDEALRQRDTERAARLRAEAERDEAQRCLGAINIAEVRRLSADGLATEAVALRSHLAAAEAERDQGLAEANDLRSRVERLVAGAAKLTERAEEAEEDRRLADFRVTAAESRADGFAVTITALRARAQRLESVLDDLTFDRHGVPQMWPSAEAVAAAKADAPAKEASDG